MALLHVNMIIIQLFYVLILYRLVIGILLNAEVTPSIQIVSILMYKVK